MNKLNKIIISLVVLLGVAALGLAGDLQSKYSTTSDGTAAALNFGVASAGWQVKAVYGKVVTADATVAQIEFLARSGTPAFMVTAPTNAATVLAVDNADTIFTLGGSDKVMYAYSDGLEPLYTTTTTATVDSVTLTAGISQAGTVKDRLYKVATAAVIVTATTAFNEQGPAVYASPSDSPMRVTMGTGTNISLVVTAAK